MRHLFSVCFAMMIFLMAFSPSQQFRITGFVKDQNGAPVIGATIMEKQSQHTVLSGNDGSFSLLVSGAKVVLIIQMVGYEQQELSLNANDKPVNIQLIPLTQSLNEVVVKGYGISRKKDITGSAAPVSSAYHKAPQDFYDDKEIVVYKGNANKIRYSDSTVFNTEEYDAITENPF